MAILVVVDGLSRVLRFIARSTRRLAILIVGLVVVAVGIALLFLPGPGWLVIFAGLAILATEFTWAEVLMERAKRQAVKAKDSVWARIKGRRLRRAEADALEVVSEALSHPKPEGQRERDDLAS